jgi:hypothetical protein
MTITASTYATHKVNTLASCSLSLFSLSLLSSLRYYLKLQKYFREKNFPLVTINQLFFFNLYN